MSKFIIVPILFVVGPHGSGKTYLCREIERKYKVLYLDCGPELRKMYDLYNKEKMSFHEWVEEIYLEKGEKWLVHNVIDLFLAYQDFSGKELFLISGCRSYSQIKEILAYLGTSNYEIIYLDNDESKLKLNYEKREGSVSEETFKKILLYDNKIGLRSLCSNVLDNKEGWYVWGDDRELIMKNVHYMVRNDRI